MNDTRARRAALRQRYGKLYDLVEEILFRHDPIGINFGDNSDEYDPEVDTILPRLDRCESVDQVRDVIASGLRPELSRDWRAQRLRLIRAPGSDPGIERAASGHLVQAPELEHSEGRP